MTWDFVKITALSALACGCVLAQGPVVRKVTGERFKLVLLSDGSVVGWGAGGDGQLGPATAGLTGVKLTSIQLPGKAIDIAATETASFALIDDGSVMSWGTGRGGELGTGSTRSDSPVRVGGLSDVIQISAGGNNVVALHRDGTVSAWGTRAFGMIGDGQHPKRYGESGPPAKTPVRVPRVSGVTQISASYSHVLALTSDGRVVAWGSNHYGALGRAPRQELPMDEAGEVSGLTGVAWVAAGTGVSTALKKDGTVWVWGANWHGQFGNGDRTDPPGTTHGFELNPHPVAGMSNVAAISIGLTGRHTLALLKDGTLRGWGNTDWGQLGAGVSGTFQLRPVIPKINGVKAVFAAGNNSFAVKADGSLWIWGSGGRGEWPLAVNTKVPVPLALP